MSNMESIWENEPIVDDARGSAIKRRWQNGGSFALKAPPVRERLFCITSLRVGGDAAQPGRPCLTAACESPWHTSPPRQVRALREAGQPGAALRFEFIDLDEALAAETRHRADLAA